MIAGVLDEFFGVPTHPLAVHAPVVLVPLLAVVAVVLAARPSWRQRVSWFMPLVVLSMAVLLWIATESGESAVDASNVFGNIDEHRELGQRTFQLSVVWFVVAVVSAGVDRMTRAPAAQADAMVQGEQPAVAAAKVPASAGTALAALAAVVALVTTVWLVRTGHAGAESRWVL